MERFSLEPNCWYAAELFSEEFGSAVRSYSPIRIDRVTPKGGRKFELAFYHANYPEGVRDKVYDLETVERNRYFAIVRSVSHEPARFMLIYCVTTDWLLCHFGVTVRDGEDAQTWLTRNA